MKAIVLAAGYATRLYPYTSNFPKALLRFGGATLLDHTLDAIQQVDAVSEVYVVTNNRFEAFFSQWAHRRPAKGGELPITVIPDGTDTNEGRRGSVGDVHYAVADKSIDDDLMVLCSDKYFGFSLQGFTDFFAEKQAVVNCCFDAGSLESIRGRHGCVLADEDNRILEYQEKPARPKSSIQSIAFYVYPRSVLPLFGTYLSTGGNPDAPGFFSEWLCQRAPMYCWLFDEECVDVGTPAAYLQALAHGRSLTRNPQDRLNVEDGPETDRITLQACMAFVCDPGEKPAGAASAELAKAVTDLEQDERVILVNVVTDRGWASHPPQFLALARSVPVNIIRPHDVSTYVQTDCVVDVRFTGSIVVLLCALRIPP